MVPFQSRESGVYYRFYHVYRQGELLKEVKLAFGTYNKYKCDIYYDNGNWCANISL